GWAVLVLCPGDAIAPDSSVLSSCGLRELRGRAPFPCAALFRSRRGRDSASAARPAGLGNGDPSRGDVAHRSCRAVRGRREAGGGDRKSTRLNSSHVKISHAVFCSKTKRDTHSRKSTRRIYPTRT